VRNFGVVTLVYAALAASNGPRFNLRRSACIPAVPGKPSARFPAPKERMIVAGGQARSAAAPGKQPPNHPRAEGAHDAAGGPA